MAFAKGGAQQGRRAPPGCRLCMLGWVIVPAKALGRRAVLAPLQQHMDPPPPAADKSAGGKAQGEEPAAPERKDEDVSHGVTPEERLRIDLG